MPSEWPTHLTIGAGTNSAALLISTQHAEHATQKQITDDLWEQVVVPVLPAELLDANALRRDSYARTAAHIGDFRREGQTAVAEATETYNAARAKGA